MNKLLKYTLVGIASIITIIPCFSNAGLVKTSYQTYVGSQNDKSYVNNSCDMICINPNGATCQDIYIAFNLNHTQYAWSIRGGGNIGNTYGFCSSEHTVYFSSFDGCSFTIDCYNFTEYTKAQCKSEYDLIEDSECVGMDSMECQTTYNLIPISEVTPNYCALNFDMIDPSECPINEGTGSIVRSNLMINDVPYAQNQNISIFIPDFLQWNIAFNDLYTTIEVEGYNADTDYIEDVINKEKLTPTNEDFSNMLVGLANFFPYLAIAFIMFYIVKLIYKLFK